MLNEARLVEDRLELDVDGPDDAEYCLDSSLARSDRLGAECSRHTGGPPWFNLDDLALDAEELVGREIVVTARSTVSTGSDGAVPFSGEVVSEPSDPIEIIDAR